MKYLEAKVTLVTRATRGIGKGIAIGLGEAGAQCTLQGAASKTLIPTIGHRVVLTKPNQQLRKLVICAFPSK
ncbi:hypothetical protein BV372_08695 [Nostoc sp. T09]|nr:hypothetical protein BV372_08695 [Nostoc sp. T09]